MFLTITSTTTDPAGLDRSQARKHGWWVELMPPQRESHSVIRFSNRRLRVMKQLSVRPYDDREALFGLLELPSFMATPPHSAVVIRFGAVFTDLARSPPYNPSTSDFHSSRIEATD
ncbi:hypothetical protein AVEN_259617-1 [Araneus ventricosus]|uniref:Uncharacterized protein n=1 Tax=Araneus ventricosus TaxID=182803 RepID=A0A4Y2U7I4_ARAVE|nr:hypothetical protein AVEN_259617-1 [Araneus ventricosus]